MDSGNSGSMQSSSGGDEEYDSRTESSISPFFNPSPHFASISNPQLSHFSHHNQNHPPVLFDHPSHNLNTFSQSLPNPNANPQYNLDFVWSRNVLHSEHPTSNQLTIGGLAHDQQSETNYTQFGNLPALSSSSPSLSLSSSLSSSQSLLTAQRLSQGPFLSSSSMPLRSVDENNAQAQPLSDQSNVVKNPKKRTRASRRAPTTVLTTDTLNFRQMVQEFTGIPAAPFSASPYSRRLDLFGAGSAMTSGHFDTPGHLYPLRTTAQKVQISPAASNNHQPSSDLGHSKQSQTMFNMQSPNLTFQSPLQSSLPPNLKHPLPIFSTQSQASSSVPSLDELGMSQGHVNAATRWRDGEASNDVVQEQLGSFAANNGSNSQDVRSYY